jgi:hypothetical protein
MVGEISEFNEIKYSTINFCLISNNNFVAFIGLFCNDIHGKYGLYSIYSYCYFIGWMFNSQKVHRMR